MNTASALSSSKSGIVYKAGFLLIALAISVVLFNKTMRFWDMLPYMGAVVSIDHNDSAQIHSTVYAEFNQYARAEMKAAMIEGHPFCKNLSVYPDKFYQQLPFFRIKMLYVYLAWIFYKLGVPLFYAVLLPSVLAFVGISLVARQWIGNYYKPLLSFVLSLLVCGFMACFSAFRIASPDAMAAFFLLMGSYFFLHKKHTGYTLLWLLLALATRVDNVIFVVSLLLFVLLFNSKNNSQQKIICLFGIGFSALLFLLAKWQSGGYDAWRMFYRSFIFLEENPYDAHIQWNASQYIQGIKNGLRASIHNKGIYLIPLFTGIFYLIGKFTRTRIENCWILAMCLSLVGRVFLHPLFETRYLMGFMLVLLLMVITRCLPVVLKNRVK